MRIENIDRKGCTYLVYGEKRGIISLHRNLSQAEIALAKDIARCKELGIECDADIYIHLYEKIWTIVNEERK